MKSTRLVVACAVLGLGAAWAVSALRQHQAAPRNHPTGIPEPAPAASSFRFVDGSVQAGLVDRVVYGGPPDRKLFGPETDGAGVALFDYDGDGWLDIYVLNGSTMQDLRAGSNHQGNFLYRNQGDGTFVETALAAGTADRGWAKGVAVGDMDNDGDPDLFVSNLGTDVLLENLGDGRFRDVSVAAGISRDFTWTASCAWGDYDGDALLDLFVTTYCYYDPHDPPVHGKHGHDCRDHKGRVINCGPHEHFPAPDYLYRNLGGGRFRNVYAQAVPESVQPYRGQAALFLDANGDGRQDIFAAHDAHPNHLFMNRGGGRLVEEGLARGCIMDAEGRIQGCMGASYQDPDADGFPDIFVSNHAGQYNTLYLNRGGYFRDATPEQPALLDADPYVGWGIAWEDLDADGWLDLVVANGHTLYWSDEPDPAWGGYEQSALLYRGTAGGGLRAVRGPLDDPLFRPRAARGMACGDLDRDGDLDLVLWIMDGSPVLLWNETPRGHWAGFVLEGVPPSNRDAYGTRVTVTAGGRHWVRWCHSDGSYESANAPWVHFGLGTASRMDRVELRWPSGRVEVVQDLAADRYYRLREGEGVLSSEGPRQSAASRKPEAQ